MQMTAPTESRVRTSGRRPSTVDGPGLLKVCVISLVLALCLPARASVSAVETDLYYVVLLRAAPNRSPLSPTDAERIQNAHMDNIRAMAARGVLVVAGPFDDTPPAISGIFVFKTSSITEARGIAAEDPTVVAHRNVVEIVAWRGPRGIGVEYQRLHAEQPGAPVGMGLQPLYLMYRGPVVTASGPVEALKAHAAYVDDLRAMGKIGAAGLTEGREDLLSIVIFNRIPEDEAARLVREDPAVKSGSLRAEPHRWWCAEHVLPGGD
jgi:uncharacterized protein YciI